MAERPKIAVVGLAFGNAIAIALSEKPASDIFELAAVCDIRKEQADKIGRRHPGVAVYYDLNDVLARPDIQAVALMTPPIGRAQLIHRIIASGKAVMATKPYERDVEAARAVLAEAVRLKIPVHVNSPVIHSEVAEQILELAKEKNLGRPIAFRAEAWSYKPKPADGSWYDDPIRCPAAPIFRVGIYIINRLVSLFGEAEKASVLHSRLLTGRPTPDNAQLSLSFRNGVIGNLFISFCVDDGMNGRESMTINFERGTLYCNVGPLKEVEARMPYEIKIMTCLGKEMPNKIESVAMKGEIGYDWKRFLNAIKNSEPNSADYNNRILAGLQIIEAMARAEQSGRIEEVYKV